MVSNNTINEIFLKSVMVLTYEYNKAVFGSNKLSKIESLRNMLYLIEEDAPSCPHWFASQKDSYKKQLISEIYSVYTDKEKPTEKKVFLDIQYIIECKELVDGLELEKPAWQLDISQNNLLRAGAKARELAISNSKNSIFIEVKALIASMLSYKKQKGVLTDWQLDMLKNEERSAKKLENIYPVFMAKNKFSEALYTKILCSAFRSEKLDLNELSGFLPKLNKKYCSERKRLLLSKGIYFLEQPADKYDMYLFDKIIDNSSDCNSQFVSIFLDSTKDLSKLKHEDLLYFYALFRKIIKKNNADSNKLFNVIWMRFLDCLLALKSDQKTDENTIFLLNRIYKMCKTEHIVIDSKPERRSDTDSMVETLLLSTSSLLQAITMKLYSLNNYRKISSFIQPNSRMKKLKKRDFSLSSTPPIIVRPHLLGGKNTLFDVEYIHSCIESILLNIDQHGTVIFVVNDKQMFKDIIDPRFYVFQFEEFSNSDYYFFLKNYEHLSTNPVGFEMFAISSYYYKRAVVDYIDIEDVLIIEGDVLLFRKISEFYTLNGNAYLSDGNACCVARLPASLLRHYCNVVTNYYSTLVYKNELQSIFSTRQKMNLPGGVCDMTFWDFINSDRHNLKHGFHWEKAEKVADSSYCDTHFRVLEPLEDNGVVIKEFDEMEYRLPGSTYKSLIGKSFNLITKNGEKYVSYHGKGTDIKVNSAHFVGGFKQVMVKVWPEVKEHLYENSKKDFA